MLLDTCVCHPRPFDMSLCNRNLVAAVREALADGRTVLGGFRTVIKVHERPLIFMTIHQYLKTYYLPLLLRPPSFFR